MAGGCGCGHGPWSDHGGFHAGPDHAEGGVRGFCTPDGRAMVLISDPVDSTASFEIYFSFLGPPIPD